MTTWDVLGWALMVFAGGTWVGFRLGQRWESMKELQDWVERNL